MEGYYASFSTMLSAHVPLVADHFRYPWGFYSKVIVFLFENLTDI
jgi:hypothetical protein